MIHWAIFSILATGLFYGLYCLLLRRDRWLQLSRVYLLATLAFSLLYPLIHLPDIGLPMPIIEGGMLPEMDIDARQTMTVAETVVQTPQQGRDVLPMLYLLGVALTLSALLVQVVRTASAIRKLPTQGKRLHLVDDDTPPHSFFNHIIIGTRNLDDEQLSSIMAHEQLHVRQRHTLDILAARLICCAAWFNPFAWLYVRELRAVHEYLADDAVLAAHGREGYLGLLYREATGTGYGHITNNFHSINIKKRITMMKRKKTRFGAWKMLATLPVAVLLMMVGCKSTNDKVEDSSNLPSATENIATGEIIEEPETMPEYVGGVDSLYSNLAANIQYPEQAKKDGVQGRVIVRFVVEADGSITNAEVLRGIGGGCDEEALRVVKAMPRWKPGTKDGKPVRTQYNLPIVFKLG